MTDEIVVHAPLFTDITKSILSDHEQVCEYVSVVQGLDKYDDVVVASTAIGIYLCYRNTVPDSIGVVTLEEDTKHC